MENKATLARGNQKTHVVVHKHESLELSRRDPIAFVEALLNPPMPTLRLQKAMQCHNYLVR